MSEEQRRVRRTLNLQIRPALAASIALTVYGNLAQAQPSVGGWVSHGWAPVLYLVLVEILVRKAVGGGWFWPVLVGFVVLALVAGVVSFTSLTHAAIRWGWAPGEAWLFPIIVDLTAVLLTMASMGAGARLRELSGEPIGVEVIGVEPNRGGRPIEPGSVRSKAKRARADRAPIEPRSDPDSRPERIIAEFGTDPNAWPGPVELAERFGVARSTASVDRRKAIEIVQQVPANTP